MNSLQSPLRHKKPPHRPKLSKTQFLCVLARRSKFQANKFAPLFGGSLRQVERYFKIELGRSPRDWLIEQKMVLARQLLVETESTKRIALDLGYKQVSHFCKDFRRFYGMTPREVVQIRKQINNNIVMR